MERGVYATATGMMTAQRAMDVIANNLANVSTNGFKREGIAFNDALQRELSQGSQPLGSLGAGPTVQSIFTDLSVGTAIETRNPLDLAIQDSKGFFAIQTPSGIRYTRDGSFGLDTNRQLVTKDGYPVLDAQLRPITLDSGSISVQSNGEIEVDGEVKGKIGVFDLPAFAKEGANRFLSLGAAQPIDTTIKSGAVEGSNVNAVDSMVQMIQLSRLFEMSQKSIHSQDEMTQRLIQSLQER